MKTAQEKYIKAAEQLTEMASSVDRVPRSDDVRILLKVIELLTDASMKRGANP